MKSFKTTLGTFTLMFGLTFTLTGQSFLTNGLVAYYPFNGSPIDASGNGNDAVPQGSPYYSIDRFGLTNSALLLSWPTQYLVVASGELNVATNAGFSVSVWVKPASSGAPMDVLEWGSSTNLGTHLFLNEQGPGRILWTPGYTAAFPSGEIDVLPSGPAVGTNFFSQLVATCDTVAGTAALYLNGVLIGSTSFQPPIISGTASDMFIGHRPLTGDQNTLAGELDDIRIYNRSLSPSQVQQLYLAEAGPFVGLIKAVKPAFSNLTISSNYQLQISTDLATWTNAGSPFTATSTNMVYPLYFDVDQWNQLFFRLQAAP